MAANVPMTTTLAESLLDDLDDLSDVEEHEQYERDHDDEELDTTIAESPREEYNAVNKSISSDGVSNKKDPGLESVGTVSHVRKRFLENPKLKSHLSTIRSISNSNSDSDESEQYQHIIETNHHLSKITLEMSKAHSELCHSYKTKFPELEELVTDPIAYKNAILCIRNEMDMTKINDELNKILNSNQVITISVAGSTTSGSPLTAEEWRVVEEACGYMDRVREVQLELIKFVERRMEDLAPNVCALVGPTIAARLLGLAGGLAELSRIPSCNLQVIGQIRQNASSRGGMSSAQYKPHMGIISECDIIKKCPGYLQRKAVKVVAAKLALAIRVDYVNAESGRKRSNDAGRGFRNEIMTKITKWDEPDKARVLKALPKPDLTTKKRRGGKRIRRLKERFEETELMKQANKRAFSREVGEYGDDAMGLTLGMLDTKDSGVLRKAAVETKKMRHANTKASRRRAIQMSSGATNGLASSMVFTPVQGLELVNPDANKDRVKEANYKWFSDTAGFQSSLPKKG